MKMDSACMMFSIQTALTTKQLKALEKWAKGRDRRIKDVPTSGLVQLHSALGKGLEVEALVQKQGKPTIISIKKGV